MNARKWGVLRRKMTSPWKQCEMSERVWAIDSEEHGMTSGKLGELCRSQLYRV